EDAELLVEPLVCDAGVIRDPAPRRFAQLVEDLARTSVRKKPLLAEMLREVTDDAAVDPRVTGRRDGLLNVNHAAFCTADNALFLFLQTSREDDIRVLRGLGHEEIDDAEKLQLLERFTRVTRIRQ